MLRPSCLTLRTSSSYFQAAQHARQLHRFVMPQGCVGWTTSPAAGDINNLTLPEATEAAAAKPTTTRADTVLARALILPKRPERLRARRRSPSPPCQHLEAGTSTP